jgi:AcrR family transcriptional regulator
VPSSTRHRLIATTSELLRRQGLAATGVKQILTSAGAPFSSLYHHFPGGKDQLAAEAIESAGAHYQRLVETVWDAAPDLVEGLTAVFDGAADVLVASDYADACPIATVALEVASTNEELRLATARVFDAWVEAASRRIAAAGVPESEATPLARAIIALLEGAFVLARSAKSIQPMEAARDAAVTLVQTRLYPREGRRSRNVMTTEGRIFPPAFLNDSAFPRADAAETGEME